MRAKLELLQAAGERYQRRTSERDDTRAKIAAGQVEAANDPEQVVRRRARQSLNQLRAEAFTERALERQIGRDNLVGVSYFERAMLAANTVGRVVVREVSGGPAIAHGTGFLVSPRLLLTNNHVLGSVAEARFSRLEMNYQADVSGATLPPSTFNLQPELFFVTSPFTALDYSLIAVAEHADDGEALTAFGWNKLIGQIGKAMKGEYLNIIQHPEGRPKQLALRDNLLIDMLELYLHYETDTLRGSSGAPVFNDDWEVVALHHTGVPRVENGNVLKRDGTPADQSTPDDQIDWIANEGVRVSRIVADLSAETGLSIAAERLRMELLDPGSQPPLMRGVARSSPPEAVTPPPAPGSAPVSFSVPLEISVRLGTPQPAATLGEPPAADQPRSTFPTTLLPAERTLSAAEYSERAGYDPAFLGTDALAVPMPNLGTHLDDAVRMTGVAGPDAHVLPYTNFSVVVSRSRRLPRCTAVNIDGTQLRLIPRAEDVWYFDPRIPRECQTGNEAYRNNPLDRGHMVRRLDPVWGDHAEQANEDTFHYTNSCPQHANLNQRTWSDLEDYILDNAGAHALRVSVFTGPILQPDDPPYRSVRLPRAFWKIAAIRRESSAGLSATAYLLSQDDLLHDLPEEFVYGAYRTYQVSVAEIEQRTGLRFGALAQADPLAEPERAREALGSTGRRLIRGGADIVFG